MPHGLHLLDQRRCIVVFYVQIPTSEIWENIQNSGPAMAEWTWSCHSPVILSNIRCAAELRFPFFSRSVAFNNIFQLFVCSPASSLLDDKSKHITFTVKVPYFSRRTQRMLSNTIYAVSQIKCIGKAFNGAILWLLEIKCTLPPIILLQYMKHF